MTSETADIEAALSLRAWAVERPVARKRARTVAGAFGRKRLTQTAREVIDEAVAAVGLELSPSILECGIEDWLVLTASADSLSSDQLPSQMVTWHEHNWTGSDTDGSVGEWLRCLKATVRGDRQFIWSGGQIAGIVTYSGWMRPGVGFYEGWGSAMRLPSPVPRSRLLENSLTSTRFDGRGIRALQGNPIGVSTELGSAVAEMAGGLNPTMLPVDEPDYDADLILWAGLHGLGPEAYIEAAVATRKSLWRRLGFPQVPERQRKLGTAGRVDLIAGDVVGEAKRAVTLNDGPDQIERYLEHLEVVRERPRSSLKGVLLQVAPDVSNAVVERVRRSPYDVELWHVDPEGRGTLVRLD